MSWINFFDEIFLINLDKREDRLLEFAEQAEKYNIPFTRIAAKEDHQGARGLRDSMKELFEHCIEKNMQHILVFEDDAEFIVEPFWFNENMDKVVEQIPVNYHICFLGCQLTVPPASFHSPNIMQVHKAYSTQSVMYSLQGMKEILSHGFYFPIDNYFSDAIEPMGHTYATYPMLCSQRDGMSDIGGRFISWKPFLEMRFEQQVAKMNKRW